MSRGSGSAEGKRKQVSWEGHKCEVRGQVTCGWWQAVGDICDQKIHGTQVCQFYLLLLLLKIVIRFNQSSFLASDLVQATDISSLELERSFLCISNRDLRCYLHLKQQVVQGLLVKPLP